MEALQEHGVVNDGLMDNRNMALLYAWRRMCQCVLHEGVRVLQAGGGNEAAAAACVCYLREAVATMRLICQGVDIATAEEIGVSLDMAVTDEMCINNFGAINPLPAALLPGLRHCYTVTRAALRDVL